jgi:hypothetical protein
MRKEKYVYVKKSNSIGIILDKGDGSDSFNMWYRTDSDGVCFEEELVFLNSKKEVRRYVKNGAKIAPSTKIAIEI